MNKHGNAALAKAYELLYHETPLGFYNCGRLCGGLCCRGNCKGMWLYPFEEDLFKNQEGFEVCETEGNYGYPMVICSGECDRAIRPLACRIFPLFPMVTDNGGKLKIEIVYDPRAAMCPLVSSRKPLDRSFIRSVRKAALYLVRDEKIREYMLAVSSELAEIDELKQRLGNLF